MADNEQHFFSQNFCNKVGYSLSVRTSGKLAANLHELELLIENL